MNTKEKKYSGSIVMISSVKNRRRAGMKFGPTATEVEWEKLSEDQQEAIDRDPFLKLSPKRVDKEEGAEKTTAKK